MLVYKKHQPALDDQQSRVARQWVEEALDRVPWFFAPGLHWVLMTGWHPTNAPRPYLTVRGFDDVGWAHRTIHVLDANGTHHLFWNGGRSFGWGKDGSLPLKFCSDCDNL
ncbi:hypothetical protein FA13DRAFT_1716733 [Coprinellus micaceus]|uniref:Uncharacterized protein n=1 Tax=Coprinellus micaceus TaxID=71717 RepID=A0A4Y7SI41_COPMI|nr:hypothetical protein FA13DRAFT_1716733 [Coprinellus micaceus]